MYNNKTIIIIIENYFRYELDPNTVKTKENYSHRSDDYYMY